MEPDDVADECTYPSDITTAEPVREPQSPAGWVQLKPLAVGAFACLCLGTSIIIYVCCLTVFECKENMFQEVYFQLTVFMQL